MSKVGLYLDSDSKQKARHRLRRYETAQKKFSRARKYDRGEYSRFYGQCGYYVERQRECIVHIPVKGAGGRIIYIPVIKRVGGEIFMVRHYGISGKQYFKQLAARKFRRTKRFDEDSYLLKGSKYKKDFDVVWSVT